MLSAEVRASAGCSSSGRFAANTRTAYRRAPAFSGVSRRRATRAMTISAVASPVETLKTYKYDTLSQHEIKALLQRPRIDFTSILNTVRAHAGCCMHVDAMSCSLAEGLLVSAVLCQNHTQAAAAHASSAAWCAGTSLRTVCRLWH